MTLQTYLHMALLNKAHKIDALRGRKFANKRNAAKLTYDVQTRVWEAWIYRNGRI